jgi:hypothetical protein
VPLNTLRQAAISNLGGFFRFCPGVTASIIRSSCTDAVLVLGHQSRDNPEGISIMARPTKYDPAYCDQVIELGKLGMSVVEMAADIGVARNTLETEWPTANPEFSQAFTLAKQHSQAWWETMGRVNLVMAPQSGTFQASVWSRSMAARFPADWREKTESKSTVDVTGGLVMIPAKSV